jgi:hypothetical protein
MRTTAQTGGSTRRGGSGEPVALPELDVSIDRGAGRVLVRDRGETFGYEFGERRGRGRAGGLGWSELTRSDHGAVIVSAVTTAEVMAICRDAGMEEEVAQITLAAGEREAARGGRQGARTDERLRDEVERGRAMERVSLRAIQARIVSMLVDGETLVNLAARGGFVDRDGRLDTTWLERRAGLMSDRCSRTGKVRIARTASYPVFVRLVRATGASPHEFDV